MAKKSKRPNRPASAKPNAQAPVNPFNPDDPKAQALFQIRLKRWLCFAVVFAFLPVCTVLVRYSVDAAAFAAFGMFVLGHVLYRWLIQSKCPRCGGWFFVKETREGKLVGSVWFPPVNQCQACGQSLHG